MQYSTDPTFALGVVNETTPFLSVQPAADLAVSMTAPVGARYYWRVRACAGSACSAYSSSWWVNVGRAVKDLNGDGHGDVAIADFSPAGATVLFGNAGILDTTPDGVINFPDDGIGMAIVGDLNADGYADISVAETAVNQLHVFLGGPGTALDTTADLVMTGGRLPTVYAAGDLNADGYDDFVVGEAFDDTGAVNGGLVHVFLGAATLDAVADATILGSFVNGHLGTHCAPAGDVNGDGYADLLVGEPFVPPDAGPGGATPAGNAYVFLGGTVLDSIADTTFAGTELGDMVGASLAGGDVDGDGFSDVMICAPYLDLTGTNLGRCDLYLGNAGTLDTVSDGTLDGTATGDLFGSGVAIGDVNADGYADVVLGAAGASDARVFFGGPTTFDTMWDGALNGGVGNQFGYSVAVAGDVNGDAVRDIIIGAPTGNMGLGAAYVYNGTAGGFDTTVDATLTTTPSTDFGWIVN